MLGDWSGLFPEMFGNHGRREDPEVEMQLAPWDEVLAQTPEDARFQLEILRRQVEGQPVRLWRGEDDRVLMDAPLWWQSAEPQRYAAAVMVLHETGVEEAAKFLGPRLPRLGG